jgi:DNA-binding beta-propeller fold protein YncE
MAALTLATIVGVGILSTTARLQPAQKGGEEETGPYEVVANWPQPWSGPGYIWGSQPGVFAETPNRVFIVARGEIKLPAQTGRGFNGSWGSTGERATVPKAEMHNCIVIVDASGKLVESWSQWDHLFEGGGGPHKIRISPYDPERHVWVVNDSRHVIYEFSNDGKQLVRTLGETDVAGEDEKHFGSPQDIAWLPDGGLLVADGLRNARVARFDKGGKFATSWGSRGNASGQFTGLHGIATDREGKIYVADRSNRRIQIFDQRGTYLDQWPDLRQANDVLLPADGQSVWVADGTNAKLLKYDVNGKLLHSWGTYGMFPGGFWEAHQLSVDSDGNLYVADSFGGRTQKFRPKAGVDRARLIGAPLPLMTRGR